MTEHKLIVNQVFMLQYGHRRIFTSTVRQAAQQGNEAAVNAQVHNLLLNMGSGISTNYSYFNDKVSNEWFVKLVQEINLTDARRKFMTRIKDVAESGSSAAIETFCGIMLPGTVSRADWGFEYVEFWSRGNDSFQIDSGE